MHSKTKTKQILEEESELFAINKIIQIPHHFQVALICFSLL